MKQNPRVDQYRHLSFAVVGGFFGAYAILVRCGVLANAQTMNLLEMLINALSGDRIHALMRLGALLLYVFGTMLTVLIPHYLHWDMRRLCPIMEGAMALLLGFFPIDMPLILSLYPIFFSMSIQWGTFAGAQGYLSSTIFSTNNTKQTSLSLARYLCDKDKKHLKKMYFFLSTLLCYHIGAVVCYFAVQWLAVRAIWCLLPFLAWAFYMVVQEEQYAKANNLQLS